MLLADEAVRELTKQGLHVEVLIGPQGHHRYHITSSDGDVYQISHEQLMYLLQAKKLTSAGVKAVIADEQAENPRV